jgi:hypothetical protein
MAFQVNPTMPTGWSWVTVTTKVGPQSKINRKKIHVCERCIVMFDQAMKTMIHNTNQQGPSDDQDG